MNLYFTIPIGEIAKWEITGLEIMGFLSGKMHWFTLPVYESITLFLSVIITSISVIIFNTDYCNLKILCYCKE